MPPYQPIIHIHKKGFALIVGSEERYIQLSAEDCNFVFDITRIMANVHDFATIFPPTSAREVPVQFEVTTVKWRTQSVTSGSET
ncbi:uncharacterized protein KY384_004087 [Bacidia gigantensis]|uniref:uncharacterized protein n=1 Tax=Bacidia gigantensis TaxID=2732470 RepID=UPI001D043A4B|nr:uncharacterized protein KY384_004087 [Bacidia gigantensis]KAG8530730.1 hypothetical protein KY384_004087 [Bacidia gigantensis]